MAAAIRISRMAVVALVAGILALVSGILAVFSRSDLFLVGVVLFGCLAFVCGIVGRIAIMRAGGTLRGKGLAAWGMGTPIAGFVLGFLLLPFT